MELSLLATKVRIPPEHHQEVSRPRLLDALGDRVPHYKLTVLAAPAGYGKTTLLAQWARASHFPIAWLSLDEEDNDFERFFRYLLAAWAAVDPGIRDSQLGVLLGAMSPDKEAVLSAFINAADEITEPTVFVLDDYHLIEELAIHDALTFLLDHLPATLHFVLAVRGEPPLPLARYRARRELLEFGADDLQFLPEETVDFLKERMGLELAHDEVMALQAQLEGWIAGLQLAALTARRQRETADKLVISGRHRFIADYLSEDVLAPMSDGIRQFLLQTSILDRLCGPLCNAVTGEDDGQEMLERLERENLFLVPLDDSRDWFRYHPLFADFLYEELNRRHPDEVINLHRRAARWYLAQELPEPAFHHAVAGDDPELVGRIAERYGNVMLNTGELTVVKRWLDSLPAAWYETQPALGVLRAGFLAFTGEFEAGLRGIEDVERQLTSAEAEASRWQLAMVRTIQCFMACMQNDLARAEALADQALRDLREESLSFRAGIYHVLGDTYRRNGRWEEARACYLKVPALTAAPGYHLQSVVQSVHIFGALADLELQQGRLRNAAGYWSRALAALRKPESWGRIELPVIGWVYIRMGEILYEWNELAEAGHHLSRGLKRAELSGDVRSLIAAYLLAGRLVLTEGDIAAAADYLERARPLVENAPFPDWVGRFGRFRLECWLAQERLRAAVHWADEMVQGEGQPPGPTALQVPLQGPLESKEAELAKARVLIVKGDASSIEQALALLKELLQVAEDEGRVGICIEAQALRALAHWKRGDEVSAMTSLEHALRLAEPEGYVRLFADLGLPMARLLQEAESRNVMPDYVAELLAAFGDERTGTRETPSVALPEPLTPREQEVMELLAAGLTNREIGEALVISPQTVKKHTGNIYGKLAVGNRTEAVARARELDLLD